MQKGEFSWLLATYQNVYNQFADFHTTLRMTFKNLVQSNHEILPKGQFIHNIQLLKMKISDHAGLQIFGQKSANRDKNVLLQLAQILDG